MFKRSLFAFSATVPPWARASPLTMFLDHNDAPQSVGLLWASDQLVVKTCAWHHKTFTTEKLPFEPTISAGERPQTMRPMGPSSREAYLMLFEMLTLHVRSFMIFVLSICDIFLNVRSWLFWRCHLSVFIPLVVKRRCVLVLYRMKMSISVPCQSQNCDISFVIA